MRCLIDNRFLAGWHWNLVFKAFLTMIFTVCTENPIENVKSYGLNSYLSSLQ